MSKVFITRIPARKDGDVWVPTFDVSPAKEYGELEIMLPMGMNYANPDQYQKKLVECLQNFNEEEDCLLALSDPALIVVAGAILGAMFPRFKILVWDRTLKRYFPQVVEFDI